MLLISDESPRIDTRLALSTVTSVRNRYHGTYGWQSLADKRGVKLILGEQAGNQLTLSTTGLVRFD